MASSRSSVRSPSSPKRFGCEVPRIFTPPLRELTPETSLGFAAIEFAEQVMGWTLDPWQKWLLIHMLELLPDGSLRFRTVVVLVARQNGKSTLSVVLSLFFMFILGRQLVIGTAQDLDVAEEIWQAAVDTVEDTEELAEQLNRVVKVNGKKSLELTSGERYKVKAANRRAGRGLSGDLILLDELREHQSWEAWGAITKTTMARAFALIVALSNAGDATSVVLRYLRKMAHLALGDPDGINAADDPGALLAEDVEPEDVVEDEDTLAIFEWSAPPGCDRWDRDGWAQANPSLGYRITERTIAAACRTDPEWIFRTEVLCQWSEGSLEGPFPPGAWESGLDEQSEIPEDASLSWCVDVSKDRERSAIAVAGRRSDGVPHVEIAASRAGVDWVVPWFAERASPENPMTVTLQSKGAPVSSLAESIEAIPGVTLVPWGGSDLGNATGQLFDAVKASGLTEQAGGPPVRAGVAHLPQPLLDVAAATAVPKMFAGGGVVWDRIKSPTDIAPLIAVTGALWLMSQDTAPARSAYEDHDLMIL